MWPHISVLFDGDPKNQLSILKSLLRHGYNVIEFSVPKAGLLENLFIDLINPGKIDFPIDIVDETQKQKQILIEV